MKKIISIVLIALLLISSVFAATSIDKTEINSLFEDKEVIESVVDVQDSQDNSKKQEILEARDSTRDFVIFDDPVIFHEFAQFYDYATMFEVYMQYLYADFIDAEHIHVENLYVEDEANFEELEVEELEVDWLEVEDQAYIEELDVEEAYIEELEVDELRLQGQPIPEIAYACLDEDNILFRSSVPCHELNEEEELALVFQYIGQIQEVMFENQFFEIKLVDVLDEEAVFIINGDYGLVEEGDDANFGGLHFELDYIVYDDDEFESLIIVLEDTTGIVVMEVGDYPFDYEFNRIYENLRFSSPGVPMQDIEIIAANAQTGEISLDINDAPTAVIVSQGVNESIQGIEFMFTDIDFDNDGELENAEITVFGVTIDEPELELWFNDIDDTFTINLEDQEFEIRLTSVFDEDNPFLDGMGAAFKINGDYDFATLNEVTSINGLLFEIDQLYFDDEEFDLLKINLYGVVPTEPIHEIESFPFTYELGSLFDNLRFHYPGTPIQDIEIVGANSQTEILYLEINDLVPYTILGEGEVVNVQGINFVFDNIDFNQYTVESAEIIVFGVNNTPEPETPLYPDHFITINEFNGLFVFGESASANDILYLEDIISNFPAIIPSGPISDVEVEDITAQNIITVGTACENSVIYEVLDNPEPCDYYEVEGIGILYAAEVDDEIYTLIVDGFDFEARFAAKEVLLNWHLYQDDFDLRQGAVCVHLIDDIEISNSSDRDYTVSYC